jgi:RNA polymerase sporulation-specific sigma factor
MTDEELALSSQRGDKSAWEELYKRYKPKVLSIARRFFLSGGEVEDLVQEGMCGLYSAVNGYKKDGGSFAGFAYRCIKNRIVDAVKKSETPKYAALNGFLPIDTLGEELYSSTEDTEREVIDRESRREFLQKMSKLLSALEFKAIVLYIDGLTMSEISKALDIPIKSVDNAITRAKHKLLNIISQDK